MDDLEKKLFPQFDDEMPGVRANALEAWREHLKKAGRAVPRSRRRSRKRDAAGQGRRAEKKLAEYMKANAAAAEARCRTTGARSSQRLKAALWVKANWKMIGAVAAALLVVVTGCWAYERYWSRSEAVNAGLRAAVASATWGEGWSEPFARRIGGEPYWLMFRGDIDASSYSDNHGQPVEMRCLHLYAAPARTGLRPVPQAVAAQFPRLGQLARAGDAVQALPQSASGHSMTERKTAGRLSIFHKVDAGNVPAPWVPPELPAAKDAPGRCRGKT